MNDYTYVVRIQLTPEEKKEIEAARKRLLADAGLADAGRQLTVASYMLGAALGLARGQLVGRGAP